MRLWAPPGQLGANRTSQAQASPSPAHGLLQVVRADEEGCVTGLNGNKLKLNPSWVNPTGEGWLGWLG